jgi:hypothetical protein
MKRTLYVLTAIAALAFASAAGAEPPVVNVVNVQKDVTDVQQETNPCTGNPTLVTSVGRFTSRITVFADGTMRVLFTMHGDLAVDSIDPAEADYTGSWTESSSFNGTNGSATSSFTFTPHLNGTDGSKLRYHYTGHMTVTANGDVSVDLFHTVANTDCLNL